MPKTPRVEIKLHIYKLLCQNLEELEKIEEKLKKKYQDAKELRKERTDILRLQKSLLRKAEVTKEDK